MNRRVCGSARRAVPLAVLMRLGAILGAMMIMAGIGVISASASDKLVSTHTIGDPVEVATWAFHPTAFYGLGRWGVCYSGWPAGAPPWLNLYDSAALLHAKASDSPTGDSFTPTAAAGVNSILVVYCYEDYPATDFMIVGVLYDAQGTQLDRKYLHENGDFPYYDVSLANRAGTDEFLVVYRRKPDTATGPHVFGLRVDTGTGQIVVSSSPNDYGAGLCPPDVAYGLKHINADVTTDRYCVVWRLGSGATAVTGRLAWPSTGAASTALTLTDYGDYVGDPVIAAEHEGSDYDFIVAWSHGNSPDSATLVAQRLTGAGVLLGSTFTVAAACTYDIDVTASDTEYLFVYRDMEEPYTHYDRILGRYCSFTGSLLVPPFVISDNVDGWERSPSVASDGTYFLVAYEFEGLDSATDQVYFQRVGEGAFTYVPGDVSAASHAARGVAWGDSYRPADALPDLFVAVTGSAASLYFVNEGGILDQRLGAGVTQVLSAEGAAWADFDNDGLLDIYVSSDAGPNELYRCTSSASPSFTAVGATMGVADGNNGRSIAWGDYDGDGWLDIYLANRGASNRLFRNLGGAAFVDVAVAAGVADAGNAEGVAFVDFDNDGDLDIYVGNAQSANRLFRNDGGTFSDVAAAWNVAPVAMARSVSWADYDNDGNFDLYIANGNSANCLYRFAETSFSDVAPSLGLNDSGSGASACWADFDLDGDLDLFLANFGSQCRLWRNENHGESFTEIGALVGLDYVGLSFGAAWADMDDDGDPDLCLGGFSFAGYEETTRIYRNDFTTGNHWVKILLQGVTDNRCGIGTRVRCVAGPLVQVRDVGGGDGYLSQNDRTLIFGLESLTSVDTLRVRWPSGAVERYCGLAVDQTHVLVQGTGQTATDETSVVPSTLRLLGNRPNPFNPCTRIDFEIPVAADVELSLFDTRGRRVVVLVNGMLPAGRHAVDWYGRDVAAGVYIARLRSIGTSDTRSLVLVR